MKCPACGMDNPEGSQFCQNCGGNINAGGAQQSSSAPPPPPSYRPAPSGGAFSFDLGDWISKGFNEVFSNIGTYLVLGLIVVLCAGFTMGILGPPLMAGALTIIRRKIRGEVSVIDPGSVFNVGFAKFGPTFLAALILILPIVLIEFIPVIGFIVALVCMPVAVVCLSVAFHYIMEENKEFGDAIKLGIGVVKENPGMYWVLGIVTGLCAGAGIIACFVGVLLTVPAMIVANSYFLEARFPRR